MALLGIDLGTSNSLAALWKEGQAQLVPNALGELLTPSAVSLDDDGSVLVGQAAKERLVSAPEQSVTGFKRFMGTDKSWTLAGRRFLPEELSALVLRKLREDAEAWLGESISEAVVSVPAYFNDSQRAATKRAGLLAGLKVERLINEPSAAALACRMHDPEGDNTAVVFDFGGGTLDVSVVESFENVISITAVCGDNRLGGSDFDHEIALRFCEKNQLFFEQLTPQERAALLRQAELCKRQLSSQKEVLLQVPNLDGSLSLNNQQLIDLCSPLFQRMATPLRRALADSRTPLEAVDSFILAGGSCKMPVVQGFLRHLLQRELDQPLSPDTVVALGAGVYSGIKERNPAIRDLVLTDLCPFTLGTGITSGEANGPLRLSPIIERNSVLPTSKTQNYYTISDMQSRLIVDVYQGEERLCKDNLKLGELEVPVPARPAGEEGVAVRFTYDLNGILEVETTVLSSGETWCKVFLGQGSDMSQEEAQKRLQELAALKIHPREREENRTLLAWAERLYAETLGPERERIAAMYDRFQTVLASQEDWRIHRARPDFALFLEQMESRLQGFGIFPSDPQNEEAWESMARSWTDEEQDNLEQEEDDRIASGRRRRGPGQGFIH